MPAADPKQKPNSENTGGPVPSSRSWVEFLLSAPASTLDFIGSTVDGGVTRLKVDQMDTIKGAPLPVQKGWQVLRVESRESIPPNPCDLRLSGTAQHVMYTTSSVRKQLLATTRTKKGNIAVLIPISKTEAWWALAQDQRMALMKEAAGHKGHIGIGARFSEKILRRLYHARFQPNSQWDFLTYFEFDASEKDDFRRMLDLLRNPQHNPEWSYVARETEVWMRKTAG